MDAKASRKHRESIAKASRGPLTPSNCAHASAHPHHIHLKSLLTCSVVSLFVLSDPISLNHNVCCANSLMSHPGTSIHPGTLIRLSRVPRHVCVYYALSSLVSAADPTGEKLSSCVGAAKRCKAESHISGYLGCAIVLASGCGAIRIIKS